MSALATTPSSSFLSLRKNGRLNDYRAHHLLPRYASVILDAVCFSFRFGYAKLQAHHLF
jgi:hypothetical protein